MNAGSNKWVTPLIALAVGGAIGFVIPQGEKSELSRQVTDLTAQLGEQTPKLEVAEKSVGELTEKLKQTNASLAEKSDMLEEANKAKSAVDEKLADVEAMLAEHKSSLAATAEETGSTSAALEAAKSELDSMAADLADKTRDLADKTRDLADKTKDLAAEKLKSTNLASMVEKLKSDAAASAKQIADQNVIIDDLKKRLQEASSQ